MTLVQLLQHSVVLIVVVVVVVVVIGVVVVVVGRGVVGFGL